ncbi:hypothetical protein GZH53_15630 [Flavihumibacter sp. R14]|nr:hypothetical protein [Flavihumibacter soli]
MLKIKITDGDPATGLLKFKVNGWPSKEGNGRAKKNAPVRWTFKSGTRVLSILDINMKTGNGAPPSTDIFSADPPTPQTDGSWAATVNQGATVGEEYNYYISWQSAVGPREHDPKISVMPSSSPFKKLLIGVSTFVGILVTLRFLNKKIKK